MVVFNSGLGPALAGLALIGVSASAAAQPSTDPIEVGFLTETPVIDGRLDDAASGLPALAFAHVFTFDNPPVDQAEVSYRLGYTPTHLYLFIQTDAVLTEHRRGWVWGDGYKLILTLPEDGQPRAQDFYDLGFSPNSYPGYEAFNQVVLTHNHDQVFRAFSDQTQSIAAPNADGTGFEALIAWSDIPPFHPWLQDRIGFNLYFAKAYLHAENGQFPHGHAVTPDEGIWEEELVDRSFVPLRFTAPPLSTERAVLGRPLLGRVSAGQALPIRLAAAGVDAGALTTDIRLLAGDGAELRVDTLTLPETSGALARVRRVLPLAELEPGEYGLQVADGAIQAFTVLPDIAFEDHAAALLANADGLPDGAVDTLMFKLTTLRAALEERPAYEAAPDLLADWRLLEAELAQFARGEDPYTGRPGPYRRGFLSAQDQTYQPYTLRLPEDYDPERPTPLMVFLHGSGQDDQRMLDRSWTEGRFIELAPLGRDMYRAYSEPASQLDILEAIEDVRAHFNVDADQIFIAGFSMGGYGALRTFYETPELYAGVAVFAGHPDLAREWTGQDHPNFLDPAYQAVFADMPVFIYHGDADEALDPELMRQLAQDLDAAGAEVTAAFAPDRGHRGPDEASAALYHDWLAAQRD